MAKSFLGIDVSEHSIKIVELIRKKDAVVLSNYGIFPLTTDDFDEENQDKDAVIVKKIEDFLRDNNVKTKKANIFVSGQSVFTRLVKLPAVEKTKLHQIVQYEAQQQIPFPINEVVWSYQVLDRQGDTTELNALLVAIKSEMAIKIFSSFDSKKFQIEIIDLSALALYNALNYNNFIQDDVCTAILNIGAKSTYIVIVESGVIWTRTIPIGSEQVTKAIAEELGINAEEAEKLKKESLENIKDDDARYDKVEAIRKRIYTRLISEIARSVGFYRTQFIGNNVERFLLCGGGSSLSGIVDLIQEKYSDARVEKIDVFSSIQVEPELLKVKNFKEEKYLLGEAVGLALRGITECKINIDLVPDELRQQRMLVSRQKYIIASLAIIVFCLIAYFFYSSRVIDINKKAILMMDNIIVESQSLGTERNKLVDQIEKIDKKYDILKECVSLKSIWLEILLEIESIIPKNIWLLSIAPFSGEQEEIDSSEAKEDEQRKRGRSRRRVPVVEEVKGVEIKEIEAILITGKTTGMYKDLILFRDNLKKSLYFSDSESGVKIISAKPPVQGEREFTISILLKKKIKI